MSDIQWPQSEATNLTPLTPLTLRQVYASQALVGLLAHHPYAMDVSPASIAGRAFAIADAMIAEEGRQ